MCFVLLAIKLTAQDIGLSDDFNGTLEQFIQQVESENSVQFLYKKEWIDGVEVQFSRGDNLNNTLNAAADKNGLSVVYRDYFIVVIPANPILFVEADQLAENYGRDVKIVGEKTGNESSVQLTIKAVNGTDKSDLVGVRIFSEELKSGGVTDLNGEITFEIEPGLYSFHLSHLGFEENTINVLTKGSGSITIDLFETSVVLDEVTISAQNAIDNVQSARMGVTSLSPDLVKKLPALYGEADVVKTITFLPGITTAGEGTQGFSVRGGNTDQNLLLYDGSTIYNASHLFGFFSNINSDFVGSAVLYKSSIPARYGGRSSSVLSIESEEPGFDHFNMDLGVGMVSSKAFAEIPIVKNKTSLLVAGRTSYINWILGRQKNVRISRSSGKFNDVNAKLVHKIGDQDRISISGYRSFDEFKFSGDTTYGWTTQTVAATWDHIFSKLLSLRVSGGISDYAFDINGLEEPFSFTLTNGVSNKHLTTQFYYEPNASMKIEGGLEYKDLELNPGEYSLPEGSQVIPADLQNEHADVMSVFAQAEQKITSRLSAEYGLRANSYRYLGPRIVDSYVPGTLRTDASIIGQETYVDNQKIVGYMNIEPRLSIGFTLNQVSSLKASYNRHHQYLHSLSNTSSITPIEIWKASDQFLEPLRNDQVSLGYFRNFKENQFETSLEFYYRQLDNIIDYRNAARILLNPSMEQAIIAGNGRGYGMELYIKKNTGRLTGWLSYSFSRTEKQIKGNFPEETVNNGNFYPAEFDRPHNLSIVGSYQVNRRLYFGANFLYSTGTPFTGPEVRFVSNNTFLTYFTERNQYRIPTYHRLDLSMRIDESLRKEKKLRGSWVFSIYNIYARRNAYSIFIGERNSSSPTAFQLSVLGRIFPSIAYNLRIE